MADFPKTVRTRAGFTIFMKPRLPAALSVHAHTLFPDFPAHFCHWPEGVVYVSDGLRKVHKWDGLKPTFVPVGLDAPTDTPTLAFAGSGSITGTYRIYVRFLDEDGRPSPLSPASDDEDASADASFTYGNLPTPTDPRVVMRQVLRNVAGDLNTFYVDIETTDLWSTSLTSTTSDDDISLNDFVALFDDEGNDLSDIFDPPRADKPYLVAHRARLWAFGEVIYQRGNAQVTTGSETVYGVGTAWTEQMIGREFIAIGDVKRHLISDVSEADQTLTLTEVYRGPTNLFQTYMIRTAPENRTTGFYSEAGNPDGWPALNRVTIQERGDEPTGVIHAESFLYAAFREALYRVSFSVDFKTDGDCSLVSFRGLANHRCWVAMAGELFCLDHLGVYKLTDGGVEELALPIRDTFTAHAKGEFKINWSKVQFFHAVADPENQQIRFFVAMNGPTMPRHSIVYNVLTRQFSLDEYPFPVVASCLYHSDRDRVLMSGPGTKLLEAGPGYLDGMNPTGYVTTAPVTSASLMTVTVPTLTLPTVGIVGYPVAVIRGKGIGQFRRVESFDATTGVLRVDFPWLDKPDSTSEIQVGAIKWRWKSGWHAQLNVESAPTEIVWTPVPELAYLNVRFYFDHRDTPVLMKQDRLSDFAPLRALAGKPDIQVDLRFTGGFAQIFIGQDFDRLSNTGRYLAFEIGGFSGAGGICINSVGVGGVQE